MNKTNSKRAWGLLIMFFAGLLWSMNNNPPTEGRVPRLIIVALTAIGGALFWSGKCWRKRAREKSDLQGDRGPQPVAVVSEKAPTESEEAERQIATQGESIMQNSDAERTNVDHEEVQPVMVSDGQQVQSNSVVQQTTIEQVGTEESMEDSSSMAVPHAASVAECAAVGQSDTADHVQGEKVECGVAAKNQQNEIDAKEEYKWLALIVLLMIFIIAIGVRFGSPSPIKDTRASVWKRHLSTPSSRLEGYWRGGSETLHYFVDNSLETGTFFLSDTATKLDQRVQFKILSEERSGKKLLVREYWSLDGSHDWVEVEYTISKDGKSLAKEYRQWDGKGWLDVYSYDEKSTKTFEEGFDIWRKRRFVPEPQD